MFHIPTFTKLGEKENIFFIHIKVSYFLKKRYNKRCFYMSEFIKGVI